MSATDIRALRERNPQILVLTSINTVENRGLPEDYYLHDTRGQKIEVWPGTYRLNLTKRYVAEYQARWAYQKMIDSQLMYDGCFFDNFYTSQAWVKADVHGHAVQVDADEDGRPDDPVWLDATWRQGVFHELELWRQLMPNAYASGHLPNPVAPEVGAIFNGNSVLFWATNVLDGKASFNDFRSLYEGWMTGGHQPPLTTIEASPQNQIGYGYGYDILHTMPAATQAFARDYHPYLRFGLALALMNDGSFHRDLGDIYHGIDWWYDEYDFDLGYPTGPATKLPSGTTPPNLVANPGFELALAGSWTLGISAGASATVSRDGSSHAGSASARVDVTAPGLDWHVELAQRDRSLVKGTSYDVGFWAKASTPRTIRVSAQQQVAPWTNYGLARQVSLTTAWAFYTVSFEANASVADSRLQFFVGDNAGSVWFDDVELRVSAGDSWRRDFTNGVVIVNGTRGPITVELGPGYEHFVGQQAARDEFIVDDDDAEFVAGSGWKTAQFDTGQWKTTGPYYHHWGAACHVLDGSASSAQWDLRIPADGTYTIEAWWAAAPEQPAWTRQAVYDVVAGSTVLATGTLDQTQTGDQWRAVATVALKAADHPILRVRNGGSGRLVADGIHLFSRERLNDGAPVTTVRVPAMDGVLLHRR